MAFLRLIKANPLIAIATVVFLLMSTKIALAERKIGALEIEADSLALEITNQAALDDSTRTIMVEGFDTAMVTFARLIVQKDVTNDSLGIVLDVEVRARQRLTARIRSLTTTVESTEPPVITPEGTRTDTWDVRQVPYTIHAVTTLPPPPANSALTLTVDLDQVDFTVRLACHETDERIDAAEIFLTGPNWLTFEIGEVEQAPEICNPPTVVSPGTPLWQDIIFGAGVGAITALVFGDDAGVGGLLGGGLSIGWRIVF